MKAALGEARRLRAEIAALPEGLDAELVADLKAELAGLVHEGFVAATPDPWLDALERYLKALRRRAQKLGEPRRTVAEAQWQYLEARRRYAALVARLEPGEPRAAAIGELRWLLEEYAVQLFAQDLKTLVPVSAKRIGQSFTAVEAALARR